MLSVVQRLLFHAITSRHFKSSFLCCSYKINQHMKPGSLVTFDTHFLPEICTCSLSLSLTFLRTSSFTNSSSISYASLLPRSFSKGSVLIRVFPKVCTICSRTFCLVLKLSCEITKAVKYTAVKTCQDLMFYRYAMFACYHVRSSTSYGQ